MSVIPADLSGRGISERHLLSVTVDTDGSFKAVPTFDLGSTRIGGMAGVRITPKAWVGDTETFGLGYVYLHVDQFETSVDGTHWTVIEPGSFALSNPIVFPTTPLLDVFTGGALAPPNASWGTLLGGTALRQDGSGKLDSNSSSALGFGYWTEPFAADQEVYALCSTAMPDTQHALLYLRTVNPGSSNALRYALYYTRGTGAAADSIDFRRYNQDSSTTALPGGWNLASKLEAGDWLGFSARGNILTAWEKHGAGAWSSPASYDTTYDSVKYANGGFIGMATYGQVGKWDSFSGGSAVGGEGLFNLEDYVVYLPACARFVRITMYLATSGDVIYAGGKAPVLTTQVDIEG